MIKLQKLKEVFLYSKETGEFKRKNKNGKVGSVNKKGYLCIYFDGKIYKAHRLAWLCVYGEYPKKDIDHINHNKLDNRIANLRLVDVCENNKNRSKNKNNTSGATGINYREETKRWRATIRVDKKLKHLGYFKCKEDAIDARRKAQARFKFHKNHGGFENV